MLNIYDYSTQLSTHILSNVIPGRETVKVLDIRENILVRKPSGEGRGSREENGKEAEGEKRDER